MPILDLLLVLPEGETRRAGLAQSVADVAAACLSAAPGRVWVRLQAIASSDYAENGMAIEEADLPAFVTVLHAHPPEGAARTDEVARLTAAIAACLERSADRVHIEYAPPGAGRIAFGGKLVPVSGMDH